MTMIGEDSNAAPTGGLPGNYSGYLHWREADSARIRYRRGQRAVSKWRNNGSLTSREYLLANEPLFLLHTTNSSGKLPPPTGTSYRFR